MHLAARAFLNQPAKLRHAVRIKNGRAEGFFYFSPNRGIQRLTTRENDAHWNLFAACECEIREDTKGRRKPLQHDALVRAKELEIYGCSLFREMEDAHQNLPLGYVVNPEGRFRPPNRRHSRALQGEARSAGIHSGPFTLAQEKGPVHARDSLGVRHPQIAAGGPRCSSADDTRVRYDL